MNIHIDINKVVDLHTYALSRRGVLRKYLLFAHSLFLLLFKKYDLTITSPVNNDGFEYIFYKSMHRFDYDELFDSIVNECTLDKKIIESKVVYGFDLHFLDNFTKYRCLFNELNTQKLIEKLYLFSSFLFYTKILHHLKVGKCKKIVVFADMQPVDNLIVQYCRMLNKETVTLQHGLFVDYAGTYNISSVSYKNVVSDYFLTWGNNNKALIERYNPNCSVIVCGNPAIKPYKPSRKGDKFFTVFFDWDVFKGENKELLDIAYKISDKLNIKFNLRFHPSNNISNYDINDKYILNNIDYRESFFMLGHTSSMIHVCQRLGLLVFKYDSDIPTNPVDKKYCFKSADDVLIKLKSLDKYVSKYKQNIGPIGYKSLKKYNKIFNDL